MHTQWRHVNVDMYVHIASPSHGIACCQAAIQPLCYPLCQVYAVGLLCMHGCLWTCLEARRSARQRLSRPSQLLPHARSHYSRKSDGPEVSTCTLVHGVITVIASVSSTAVRAYSGVRRDAQHAYTQRKHVMLVIAARHTAS